MKDNDKKKEYVFIHAIGNDDFDNFLKKSLDGTGGENFNAFYIPEITSPLSTLPILSPQWKSHKDSILVAFDGNSVAFEGGFTRNAASSPFFLDAREENMPEKLYFIQVSYLQRTSLSTRAIFSVSKFIEKADGKLAKREKKFSDTVYADGRKVPMSLSYHGNPHQPHNEAHIRGSINKIKYLVVKEDSLKSPNQEQNLEKLGNALTLHQIITNNRYHIATFGLKPDNIIILDNFIDIEILRGTLALQKIAHLQKMLKYHELNPTIDTNQEMQLSFSYKLKKSQFATSRSLTNMEDSFSAETVEKPESQEIWIRSQKTKIQKEIDYIYRDIEDLSSELKVSEDSPIRTLKSTAESIQAEINSSTNQHDLESHYEQQQYTIRNWEESAKINLQLRSLIGAKVILDLKKPVHFRLFHYGFKNNSQLSEFNVIDFMRSSEIDSDVLFEYMATKKLYYAIINLGSIFLKNEENAATFMTAFSRFDKEFQKSILENAIQNYNHDFVNSILANKSEDPAYFLFSAIFRNDLEAMKKKLEESNVKVKSKSALIRYFSANHIIPFDTPLHLATAINNDDAILEILEIIPNLQVNTKNSQHETPLHIASRNGSLSTAETLIEKNAKSLITTKLNRISITHLASSHGFTDMLRLFAKITFLNSYGANSETPTFLAIKNRHSETAEFIIKNLNASSLASKSSNTQTLKEMAAQNSDFKSLKLLMSHRVSEKKLGNDQFTAIHYSAQNGDAKSMNLLLDEIDLAQKKRKLERLSDGKTPLVVAIMNNRYEVTKILLNHSPFDIDKPFHYKSKEINFIGMVTPLQAAILNRNLGITKLLLLSKKFDVTKESELIGVNGAEKFGQVCLSALDLAIFVNSFEIFNLLLKEGVQVSQNIQKGTYRGYNSLHLACRNNPENLWIVKALIKSQKLDINAESEHSKTSAFDIAFAAGNFEITKFLVSEEANISRLVSQPQLYILSNTAKIMEFFLEERLVKIVSDNISQLSEEKRDEFISFAIKGNCVNFVKQLLDTGCYKIDKIIHLATEQKNPKIFSLILEKLGEDVDIKTLEDDMKYSVLENAIIKNNPEAVKILLQRKEINPNQTGDKTPLRGVIQATLFALDNPGNLIEERVSNFFLIADALLNAKANIEQITEKRECELLLHISASNGNLETVRSLLDRQVKAKTIFGGLNALQVAIINQHNEVAKLLIEKEEFPFHRYVNKSFDKNHKLNVLEIAIKEDNLEILEVILKKNKGLIDNKSVFGLSLIEFAIKHNKFEAFQFLIENGASLKLSPARIPSEKTNEFSPLGFAIQLKRIEMVKFLVEKKGIDVNDAVFKLGARNSSLNAIQFVAILEENCEILNYLLKAGARTDVVVLEDGNFKGLNLLQLALASKKSIVEDVFVDSFKIDDKVVISGNLKGLSTFQAAVYNDNIDVVNKLLLKGAKIDEVVKDGNCKRLKTLDLAFVFGSDKLIQTLLLNDQIKDKFDMKKLLISSLKNLFIMGFMDSINIVFEKFDARSISDIIENTTYEINRNKRFFGLTSLQSAILQDKEEVVDFLLSKNAKVDTSITLGDYKKNNSIHLCIKNSENTAIFRKLLPHSKLTESDSSGSTPIHLMVQNYKYKFMEIYLDTEGVDPDIRSMNSSRNTALHLAIDNKDAKMVQILLTKADVNVINGKGLSPVHLAVLNENLNILEILISHPEVKINETVKDGEYKGFTALHIAIKNDSTELLKILLKHDQIDADKPIEEGYFHSFTPLELAVDFKKELSLNILLACKAQQINVKKIAENGRNQGYAPLYYAIKESKLSMIKALVLAGADINQVIETDGNHVGLNYLQYGLLSSHSKEIVSFLMMNANKDDFDKPIIKGKYESYSTQSLIENKNREPFVSNREKHLILLKKILDKKTTVPKRKKNSESYGALVDMGIFSEEIHLAGSLAEAGAGAGAGAGSWTKDKEGSRPRKKRVGSEIEEPSSGGAVSYPIPAIVVSSFDQLYDQSLQQKYITKMQEVDFDFKKEYGEVFFNTHKHLLNSEYTIFTDKTKNELNKNLSESNEAMLRDYKKSSELSLSDGIARNDVKSIYLLLLNKKHVQFLEDEYKTYQAHKNQDQVQNLGARHQLRVLSNSSQIVAQTFSSPGQSQPNPNVRIRQRDPDNGSERDPKRARS